MQQPEPSEPKTNLLLEARHTLSIAAAKRKRAKVSSSLFLPRELARKTSKLLTGSQGSNKQRRPLHRRLRKRCPNNQPESFALVRPHISRERIRNAVDILRQGIDTETESAQEHISSAMECNKKLNVNPADKAKLPDLSSTVEEPLEHRVHTPEGRHLASIKLELLNETSPTINFVVDYASVAELPDNDLHSEESEARIELANYVAASEEQRFSSKMNIAVVDKNYLTPTIVRLEMDEDIKRGKELLNEAVSIQVDNNLETVEQPIGIYTNDATNSANLPFSNRVSVIMKNQQKQLNSTASARSRTILERCLAEPINKPLPQTPPSYSNVARLPCFQTQFSRQYPHTLDTPASQMMTYQFQDLEQRRELYRQHLTYKSMQITPLWTQLSKLPKKPLAHRYQQSLQSIAEQANQKQKSLKDYRKDYQNTRPSKDVNNRDSSMTLQRRHGVFIGPQAVAAAMPGLRLTTTCSQQQQMSSRHCSEIKTYATTFTPSITTTARNCSYPESTGLRFHPKAIDAEERQMTSGQATMSTTFLNELTSAKPLNLVTSKRRKTENKTSTSLTTSTWSSSVHKLVSTAFLNQQAYRIPSNLSTNYDEQGTSSASTINSGFVHFESTKSQNQNINAGADMRRTATPAVIHQSSAVLREQKTTTKKRTHSKSHTLQQQLQQVHGTMNTDTKRQPICDQAIIPGYILHNQQSSHLIHSDDGIRPGVNLSSSATQMQTPNYGHQQMQTMPMIHYQSNPYATVNRSLNQEFQPMYNHNNHGIPSFPALHEPNSCIDGQINCFSAINHGSEYFQTLEQLKQYKNTTSIQSHVVSNQNAAIKSPQRQRQRRKIMPTMPMMLPPPPEDLQLTNPLCAMYQLGPQRMPGPPPLVTTRNNHYPISLPLTPIYQQQFNTVYPSSMAPPEALYAQQNNYFNWRFPVDATPNMSTHTTPQTTLNAGHFFGPRHDRTLVQPIDRPLMNYFDGARILNFSHGNPNNFSEAQQMVPPTTWVNSQTQNVNYFRST